MRAYSTFQELINFKTALLNALKIFIIVSVPMASGASLTCIRSTEELNVKKEKIPAAFSQIPLNLRSNPPKKAEIKISGTSSKMLKLELSAWINFFQYNDTLFIEKICFEGNSIAITFTNQKVFEGKVNESEVNMEGYTLQVVPFSKENGPKEKPKPIPPSTPERRSGVTS